MSGSERVTHPHDRPDDRSGDDFEELKTCDPLVRVTQLPCGIRVVTQHMPSLRSAALGVWVGVGARHETGQEHGLSHLLEHMAFKGTARRSAREIAEEIEQVGGDMNAATSLEQTAYYVRVLGEDVPLAVDVLSDIVRNAVFDGQELAREKDVVLQEIAGLQDMPDELAYDLVQAAAFPDHAVGRPIIGTPESVQALSADHLRDYLARHYSGDRMVVAAAGAVDHDAFVALVHAGFADHVSAKSSAPVVPRFHGGAFGHPDAFEQSHVIVGFPSPAYVRPDFITGQVFCAVLGGGMSSRLFQEVREARGLCYSIYASAWGLSDTGFLTIHAATSHDLVAELGAVVAQELTKLGDTLLDDRELARAKAQLTAGLMMSLESPVARAEQLARQLLVHGRTFGPDEIAERIARVSAADVQAFAAGLVAVAQPAVAVVGTGERSQGLGETVAASFVRKVH